MERLLIRNTAAGIKWRQKIWTIQVRGNEEQHKKILDYIKFVGAEYREV